MSLAGSKISQNKRWANDKEERKTNTELKKKRETEKRSMSRVKIYERKF
jgi:hypothetical protein